MSEETTSREVVADEAARMIRGHLEGVTHGIILVCGGDGDLSGHVQENLDGIEEFFRSPRVVDSEGIANIAVLALADFLNRDAELHFFWHSSTTTTPTTTPVWCRLGEINTGEPGFTTLFLAGALRAFSDVELVAVGFSGHGSGVRKEKDVLNSTLETGGGIRTAAARDVIEKLTKILPVSPPEGDISIEYLESSDTNTIDALTTVEIGRSLASARSLAGWCDERRQVDLLSFDACFNGMIEVAYECREFAKVFLGSMNRVPLGLWNYGAWLQLMVELPPRTAGEWARQALRAFEVAVTAFEPREPRHARQKRTLTAVRTGNVEAVARAFRQLIEELKQPSIVPDVRKALEHSQHFDEPDVRDLVEFAWGLRSFPALTGACDAVIRSVREAVLDYVVVGGVGGEQHSRFRESAVHGLVFWGPPYWCPYFDETAPTYERLAFEAATGWGQCLRLVLPLPQKPCGDSKEDGEAEPDP